MSRKFALIIGNTEYTDPGLAQLAAPGKDAEDFARVLKDREICAFNDVNILLNEPEYVVRGAIEEFFDQKKPDDLLILYFSGHGVRDELGALFLAVKNTNRFRLRSTAIKSDFVREAMDQSRSKRQVLILDCCNSGAFAQGTKAAPGVSIGTATAFESGYGRIILTASDSTQFAWEGNSVIGETDNSLFTHYLVEGLEGEADLDSDGRITVDELYNYAYEKVKQATPKQSPSKFSSKEQGEIVLREFTRLEDIKPVALLEQLISEIENPYPEVRLRAVGQLEKLLSGRNLGMARSAREALERIERDDDSRRVSQAAAQTLEPIRQAEKEDAERKAREEAERLAMQKAEEERLALEKAEFERKAKQEAERLIDEQKAADERKAKEEQLAREKAAAERKAKQEAERLLAEQKAEEEIKAKKEAKRLATLKAKEERLAREKVEAERKAKQEAARLLAGQKAEEERKAQEEAGRIAKQIAEQERLARQKAEAERKAKEEAEKLAQAKAEREATEKAAREVAEKAAKEKAEQEAMERAAGEKAKSKDRFVYVIAEDGTPLYDYFPASTSNNWHVWLEKGVKLTLTQPDIDETSIGKFGRNIKVSDEHGNEGYVRAATISIERESAKKTVKEETATKNVGDRIDVKSKIEIKPFTILPEDSIWKFGKQEIFCGLLGAILFAAVDLFLKSAFPASGLTLGLKSSILVFFSIVFGPWVGLLTGVIGYIIYVFFSKLIGLE